jgi:hypothetical protein
VLLICGVVTYVTALQRYGTVDSLGNSIADLDEPLLVAFLLCAVGRRDVGPSPPAQRSSARSSRSRCRSSCRASSA